MATLEHPPSDRTAFVRWLALFGVAILLMFLGALWLFSLLPGVDATALYAPLYGALSGTLWGILTLGIGIGAFVVARWGIVPAVLAHYQPDRTEERDTLQRLITERDNAKEAALLAETDLQNTLGHVEAWHRLITEEHRALYPTDTATLAPDAMLRTMRTELLIVRPSVERLQQVVQERDDLRTRLADHLNQPPPVVITWAELLPLVQHVAASGVKVGALRDELRKVVRIPEGEYERFSAAVRTLPAYSPTKRPSKDTTVSSVKVPELPPSAPNDGRMGTLTDARSYGRTPRTRFSGCRNLPTAKKRRPLAVRA